MKSDRVAFILWIRKITYRIFLFLLFSAIVLLPQNVQAQNGAGEFEESEEIQEIETVDTVGEIIEKFAPSEEVSIAENKVSMKKRLVVNSILEDAHDACKMYWIPENGQTVLEYASIAEAEKYYQKLSLEYDCFIDEYISADILDACYSWGGQTMHFEEMKNLQEETPYIWKTPVTVAVLDTGIDTGHNIFQNRISSKSRNFTMNDRDLSDQYGEGHGTHVSGIIADLTPENVEILFCKIFNSNGSSSRLIVSSAFEYAIHQGADLINFSASWENESEDGFLDRVLEEANQAGIPVCVAAGNEGADVRNVYPANRNSVVTVGALAEADELADYSNTGKYIDFVAPGNEIESARVGSKSKTVPMTGTSMAVPHVTAALAYIRSCHPEYDSRELLEALRKCCIDLGTAGWDASFGWGMPDLNQWLTEEKQGGTQHSYLHSYQRECIPATCTEDGKWIFQCQDCKKILEKKIPCQGHCWKSVANPSSESEVVLTCNLCGKEERLPMEGACGDSMFYQASWTYSSSYNESVCYLEFRGSGEMYSYGEGNFPWSPYIDRVKSISMDYSIRSIADYAFKGSCNLTDQNLYLPVNLEKIGVEAFANAMRLQNISIGDKVKSIGCGAFSSCSHLKGFLVGENQLYFSSDGIALYDKNQESLYACAADDSISESLNSLKLPETLKEIKERAFAGNRNMNRLDLPASINKIGENAFDGDYIEVTYHSREDAWLRLTRESYGGDLRWIYEGEKIPISVSEIQMEKGPFLYEDHAVMPTVSVLYHGELLQEGKDYRIAYDHSEKPGIGNVILEGLGFFQGREEIPYTIEKGTIEVIQKTELLENEVLHTGLGTSMPLPWELHVAGKEIIPENVDILYEVENPEILSVTEEGLVYGKKAGSTLLTLHIIEGNYHELERSILVKVEEGFLAELEETIYYYSGEEICPKAEVTNLEGQKLTENLDYQVRYQNNMEPGIGKMILQGLGSYRGILEVPFMIRKRTYSMAGISFTGQTWTYDGQEHSLAITGTLPEGVSVSYKGNEEKEAGRYTVTAIFTGDALHEAIPSKKATMVIEAADLSQMQAQLDFGNLDHISFTGNAITPKVLIPGLTEEDFEVRYQDNFEPGRATVIVDGCGNYCGEILLHFDIESNELWLEYQQMIKDAIENNQPGEGEQGGDEDPPGSTDFEDWGEEDPDEEDADEDDQDDPGSQGPSGNGSDDSSRDDYTVTGGYFITPAVTYKRPAVPKILKIRNKPSKAITLQWKKVSGIRGYKIQYSLKPNFKGAKTIKIANGKTVKRVIKKLKRGKTYYVRMCSYRLSGKKEILSKWSAKKKIKVKK